MIVRAPLPRMHGLQGLVDVGWINLLPALQSINQEIDFVILPQELGIVFVSVSSIRQCLFCCDLKLRDSGRIIPLRRTSAIVRNSSRK